MPFGLNCGATIHLTNVKYPHVFTYSRVKKGAKYPMNNAVKAGAGLTRLADGATLKPAGSTLLDSGRTMFRYNLAKLDDGEYLAITNKGMDIVSEVTFVVLDHEVKTVNGVKEYGVNSASRERVEESGPNTSAGGNKDGGREDQGEALQGGEHSPA